MQSLKKRCPIFSFQTFPVPVYRRPQQMAASKQLLCSTVLLALCQMFCAAVTQQCSPEAESSKLGMMLRRHIFKKITGVSLGDLCLLDCYQDDRCQSFNYVISQYMCELNNRTKEARPEDYVLDSDRYYFKLDMNRGEFI